MNGEETIDQKKMNEVIQVKHLAKRFRNFTANDNLTFDVYRGEIFGFLGANGAGKTTAIKILCGLSEPTEGEVNVNGFDIYKQREMIKRNIGYMSQKFSLYEDLTIEENIDFFGGIYALKRKHLKEKKEELLETLNIIHQRNKKIAELPLGWKQKLAFSIAIIHQPGIVFLDEPTGGVDPITRRQFWDMIYGAVDKGITVFVTTHYMDEAEYCDRVSIMVEGRIEVLDRPENMKKTYGAESMNDVFIKLARKKQ